MRTIVCRPKVLTPAQEEVAVQRAIEINPANAKTTRAVARTPVGRRGGLRRLALLIENRWPRAGVDLSVQFLDNASKELRTRILLHMNAWSKTANIRFRETNDTGLVRIARLDEPEDMAGYWSYVGTQIFGIKKSEPTFNLEGFTMRTSETEFRRVVRHEAGHTLGFEHEHMRSDLVRKIDKRKAIEFYDRDQGWDEQETKEQVLTPLADASLMGTTESDPTSIMCYQIPGEITKDGKEIPGGLDINEKDFAFAAKVYPKTGAPPPKPPRALELGPPLIESPKPPETLVRPKGETALPQEADTLHIVIMDEFDPEGLRSSLAECAENQAPNLVRKTAGGVKKNKPPQPPPKKKTPKFARVFASYGGARVTCAMRLRADKGEPPTPFRKIISVHEQIKNYTNREKGERPEDDKMVEFGINLFETLFQVMCGASTTKRARDSATASLISYSPL